MDFHLTIIPYIRTRNLLTMRQISILIFFLIIPSISISQISTNCLTESELLRLQRLSYNEVNTFLTNKGWSFLDNDKESQSVKYFGYNLNYIVRKWQNKKTGFIEPILCFYYINGLPNLIIYQATNNCFANLLNNQSLTGVNSNYRALVLDKPGGMALEFREYLNEITDIRFSVLVFNVASLNNLVRIENINSKVQNGDSFYNQERYSDAISLYKQALDLLNSNENILSNEIIGKINNCYRRIKIVAEISTGDSLYNQIKYIDAISHFEIARDSLKAGEMHLQNEIVTKIGNCNDRLNQIEMRNLINRAMLKGDSLLNCMDYNEARNQYNEALSLSKRLNPKNTILENEASFKFDRSDLMKYLKYGDDYFNQGLNYEALSEYNKALLEYNKALSNYNESRSKYISNTSLKDATVYSRIQIGVDTSNYRIERINDWQHTVSFCYEHITACNKFKEINNNVINTIIASRKGDGNLSYTAYINFDNAGKGNNYIKINSSSIKKINSFINEIDFSCITATKKKDYFIPSKEVMSFNLSWNTDRFKARSKASKLKITSNEIGSNVNKYIENFINQQTYKNGIYKFDATEKIFNGNNLTDIRLTSYRNNAGPMKFLYSAIMPGWGTSKVTDGKKGTSRTVWFLITAAVSVGSKIYSDIQYDNYKNGNTVSDIENYYNKADIANKVFLVSGGFAATIYLHDILWVFGKGIKNNKQSRNLKNKLEKGSILIPGT